MNINGTVFDAESINCMWPTGQVVMLEDIDYSDEYEKEAIYNHKNQFIGYGRGKYKADCKITVQMSEYELLNSLSAPFGGLYRMPPVPIVVNYKNDTGASVTDTINVTFTKRGKKPKKGDKEISVTVECAVAGPILWNGVPAYSPE
ncbi:MAG: hypothetical protein JXB50_12275 [Spirochaetes bacterium]|nr:hypothetical protein [Spirochaetota bacterium]